MAIIGIAGSKGSGKDSAAKFLTGMVMQATGIIEQYDMTEDGRLITNYESADGTKGLGIFDLDSRDPKLCQYINDVIWPHVKIYHFGDSLKYILSNMFRLELDKLFGTQEDKETLSSIKWERMVDVVPKSKLKKNIKLDSFMTHRQVMQHFGDIMRNIDDMCFVNYTLDEISREQCPISIIADVRRIEEMQAVKNAGGMLIYLTKQVDTTDTHDTEKAGDVDKSLFDIVIDNQNMSMAEKNIALLNSLKDIGFLQ